VTLPGPHVTSAFHDELVERAAVIDGHADLLGMLAEAGVLERAAAALAAPFAAARVTKVVGIEARGFIFAAPVATELAAGFVPIRKPGGIHPGAKARVVSRPDWRGRRLTLAVQRAALVPGDRALLVDDWAETGSQALAAKSLIGACGASFAGLSLLVDQLSDDVRATLAPVHAVADAAEFR
jgi:adenine phosphoribosyltransferase